MSQIQKDFTCFGLGLLLMVAAFWLWHLIPWFDAWVDSWRIFRPLRPPKHDRILHGIYRYMLCGLWMFYGLVLVYEGATR